MSLITGNYRQIGQTKKKTLPSQKSSVPPGDEKKPSFRKLKQRRLEFGCNLWKKESDISNVRVPSIVPYYSPSSSLVKDMLMLEKKLEDIGVIEFFSSSPQTNNSHNAESLKMYHKQLSINSALGDSWYLSTVGPDVVPPATSNPHSHKVNSNSYYPKIPIPISDASIKFQNNLSPILAAKYGIIPHNFPLSRANLDEDLSSLLSGSLVGSMFWSTVQSSETLDDMKESTHIPENVLRLLQIIKGLSEENDSLLRRNERLEALEERRSRVDEELANFKEQYSLMFKKIKAALVEFPENHPYHNNPSNVIKSEHSEKCIQSSHKSMKESTRILQLEKMVSGLLDRVEKGKTDLNHKNLKIKQYEACFMKLRNCSKMKFSSEISSKSSIEDKSYENVVSSNAIFPNAVREHINSVALTRSRTKSSATLTIERSFNNVCNAKS